MLVTAESCTAGLLSGAITAIPGSSDVLERGWVVYSNESKVEILGVSRELISIYGAVSEQVAHAMAEGALRKSTPYAHLAIAITGIAGPLTDGASKPVGLVHFSLAMDGQDTHNQWQNFGSIGRQEVRFASVEFSLRMILERVAT